jgi:hypothetical protein
MMMDTGQAVVSVMSNLYSEREKMKAPAIKSKPPMNLGRSYEKKRIGKGATKVKTEETLMNDSCGGWVVEKKRQALGRGKRE